MIMVCVIYAMGEGNWNDYGLCDMLWGRVTGMIMVCVICYGEGNWNDYGLCDMLWGG